MASVQELLRLFQQSGAFHYDGVAVKGSKFSGLNLTALEKYFLQYDVDFSVEEDKPNLLRNVDVMQEQELTVAGLLVFGAYPQKHLPNASISYAHYLGVNSDDELIDKQVIDGPLPEQIEKTLAIIRHNIKLPLPRHLRLAPSRNILAIPRIPMALRLMMKLICGSFGT